MAATLEQIAQEVGVTTQTVSQVLNRGKLKQVSPQTLQRIRAVAQKLEYVPNQMAASLRTKTRTVGVIGGLFRTVWLGELFSSIEQRVEQSGYTPFWADSWTKTDLELNFARRMIGWRVEGLILLAGAGVNEPLMSLVKGRCPIVAISDAYRGLCPTVHLDLEQSFFKLANHLISMGHRKIGLMRPSPMAAKTKESGYRRAMKQAGLKVDDSWVITAANRSIAALPDQLDIGRNLARSVRRMDVTAMMCESDGMAMGLVRGLSELGVDVPGQMSVTGCDDIPTAAYGRVPLTTVATPAQKLAHQACDLLFEVLKQPHTKPSFHLFECDVVLRDSAGPPPKEHLASGNN